MARRLRTALVPRRTTALVALWVICGGLFSIFVPVSAALYGMPLPLAFLLGTVVCGTPVLALTQPSISIALFCAAAFAVPLTSDAVKATTAPWPWSVPATLSFVLLIGIMTSLHGARLGSVLLTVGISASLIAPLARPEIVERSDVATAATANLIVTASLGLASFLIALLIASRLRLGAELVQEREHAALEESRRALVEERTRIARELHDVIAHSMSVIQVQASTARYRLTALPDEAIGEFDAIAATARTSLTEMRRMLGVLRTEDHSAELTPQHSIADIQELVDTMRRAGAEIGLSLIGSEIATSSPASVQIAAYRIVQESLSNSLRHASGDPVTVRVEAHDGALRIRVRNTTPSAGTDSGTGHGLRGMRERTELLGGSLTAGPASDDIWVVDATLPLDADDAVPATKENP